MSEPSEADPFTISLRKFLRQVGVTSQRAVEDAVANRRGRGEGKARVRAVITVEGTDLHHVVESELDLD